MGVVMVASWVGHARQPGHACVECGDSIAQQRAGHPAARTRPAPGTARGNTGPRSSVDEEYSAIPSKAGGRLTGSSRDRSLVEEGQALFKRHTTQQGAP